MTFDSTKLTTVALRLAQVTAMSCLVLTLSACSKEQREEAGQQAVETLKLDHEDVFKLKVGTCFDNEETTPTNAQGDQVISDVPVRECSQPHDNEVFHLYNLPEAETYVETEASMAEMNKQCAQVFQSYVGKNYDDSVYELSVMTPTAESWAQGDREVVCFLYDPEYKKLTGSAKGTAK